MAAKIKTVFQPDYEKIYTITIRKVPTWETVSKATKKKQKKTD